MDIWLERHNVAAAQGKRTMWPNSKKSYCIGGIIRECVSTGAASAQTRRSFAPADFEASSTMCTP